MNKNRKIVLGISLIIIGGIWLLSSFGVNLLSLRGFYRAFSLIWPLILVGIGVNMSFSKKLSNIIWFLLLLLFVVCTIYFTNYYIFY